MYGQLIDYETHSPKNIPSLSTATQVESWVTFRSPQKTYAASWQNSAAASS